MTTKDEALKQAIHALEFSSSYLDELADVHGTSKKAKPGSTAWHVLKAIATCREALAQKDEHEPIGEAQSYESTTRYTHCIWDANVVPVGTKLYTATPKRQPLTDEQIAECISGIFAERNYWVKFARSIEAHHGIGVEHDAR